MLFPGVSFYLIFNCNEHELAAIGCILLKIAPKKDRKNGKDNPHVQEEKVFFLRLKYA
jgi:hypothetical protein